MSEFRYPAKALRGDYARATIGLILTLVPLSTVAGESWATYVLLPIALLFLLFGWRTWTRHQTRVVIDSEGISLFSPRRVSLPWKNVQVVRLSYYALKSDRTGGWMQLTLKGVDPRHGGAQRTIRLDSMLDGFDVVARQAEQVVTENRLEVTDATRSNFAALDSAEQGLRAGAEHR